MRFDRLTLRGIGPFSKQSTLDLAAIPGRLVAITGGNGQGKSTLLECFGGALYRETPTRGSLTSLATARDAFVEVTVVNGRSWTVRQVVDGTSGKGEALVLDALGAPALPSGKVREFDAWAKSHLPSPEVLCASTFQSQGSGGLLDLGAGDSKAVLLRVLGVERLEHLAEVAREKARDARGRLATLTARIADECARGGDVSQVEASLCREKQEAIAADECAQIAQSALLEAETATAAAISAANAASEARSRRDALCARLLAAQGRRDDRDGRARNNRAVLEEADAIRAAVTRTTEIGEREHGTATGARCLDIPPPSRRTRCLPPPRRRGARPRRGGPPAANHRQDARVLGTAMQPKEWTMSNLDLDAIEALANAASPGPWRVGSVDTDPVFAWHGATMGGERQLLRFNPCFSYANDAAFIAAAREAVPALVAEVRRLRRPFDYYRRGSLAVSADPLARLGPALVEALAAVREMRATPTSTAPAESKRKRLTAAEADAIAERAMRKAGMYPRRTS